MCRLAMQAGGGTHTARWQRKWGQEDEAARSPQCAQELVNALSQDQAEEQAVQMARGIYEVYKWASASPYSLNIDWDDLGPGL
jgi:hypothetical protein